ncbi:uncharacterized SAM-binding protein YcdF (DUF218 family) [Methylorubrum rhodinum]|uniref:Uncharacterized SAM-binding protein YcdF (DUF218 family) n=2 Tax=Methylorubrum rhodinum TaxID=29428 RepID=A0A840ZRX7_9HYPH|nr:uncharacterized SAM-binding protein YcdF (DUF218 family) [Methylorubrum rhodinum]
MVGALALKPWEPLGWSWSAASPVPFRMREVRKASRGRLLLRLVAGLGLLGALALAGGFFAFVTTIERAERPAIGRTDAIVVLTGGAQRIGDAIDLLANGNGRRLLISGVNERTSREEIARLNPNQQHWIDCCIDLDYRARNTIGNAIETRRWMRRHGFTSIAVVTSNYHMPRTLVELHHALDEGETVVPYPVVSDGFDISRWWADPAAARLVGAEYVKFLVAWLRTQVESDPEQSHFAVLVGRRKPVKIVAERLMRETN